MIMLTIVLRVVIIYVIVLVLYRLMGKRQLGQMQPFELVIAVMLSAQCTDERVNKTTPSLFSRCKNLEDYMDIDIHEFSAILFCGTRRLCIL